MSDQGLNSTPQPTDTANTTMDDATLSAPRVTVTDVRAPGITASPAMVDYAAPRPSQALAAWSLGLGIAAVPFALIPFVGVFFGIASAVAAIVLGTLALRRGQSRGMSLSGIITGSVGGAIGLMNAAGSLLVVGLFGAFMLSYTPTHYTADVEAGETATITWMGTNAPDSAVTITGPWSMWADVDSMDMGEITVTADPDVQVSCTAGIEGAVGDKKVGMGTVTCWAQ